MKPPFRADGNNIYDADGRYVASAIGYGVGNADAEELVRLANLGAESPMNSGAPGMREATLSEAEAEWIRKMLDEPRTERASDGT